MAKSDVRATSLKERKPPKVLSHIEVKEGENGGHVLTHHYTHFDHPSEDHVFGKGQSMDAHRHLAKHANMPLDEAGKAAEEAEEV